MQPLEDRVPSLSHIQAFVSHPMMNNLFFVRENVKVRSPKKTAGAYVLLASVASKHWRPISDFIVSSPFKEMLRISLVVLPRKALDRVLESNDTNL